MALKNYTVAEFRKNTREAFSEIDGGGKVFISRHGMRYELRKADVQGGKHQLKQAMPTVRERVKAGTISDHAASFLAATVGPDTPIAMTKMGDHVYAANGIDAVARIDLAREATDVSRPSFITEHIGRINRADNTGFGDAQLEKAVPLQDQINDAMRSMPSPYKEGLEPIAHLSASSDIADVFGPVAPKKNIASADALGNSLDEAVEFAPDTPVNELDTPSLKGQLIIARGELNRIDIDTQDPDEVERGSELAARIGDIEDELKKRGVL